MGAVDVTINPHVLVVGFGSAGRRHAQNLARRGARISVVDTRTDRLRPPEEMKLLGAYPTVDDALAAARFDATVIATPTAFHLQQAEQLIEAKCRVMLEKPVALDLSQGQRLAAVEARYGQAVLLGYTWRWWPALRELRARLKSGAIGRVMRAEFVMASHLEDWHPWEPISDFFMSRAELGGGALLDESHWIDQMLWLLGEPQAISAHVEHTSALPIDCDDNVELLAFYADGSRARVHLDLYTRPTERSIAIYGDGGALRWNFEANVIGQYNSRVQQWRETPFAGERNDMFDALAAEFLEVVCERVAPSCTIADGISVLRIVDAARASQRAQGHIVHLASS